MSQKTAHGDRKWPSTFLDKKANECKSLTVSGCPGWDRRDPIALSRFY
jgi:hypothetical protein